MKRAEEHAGMPVKKQRFDYYLDFDRSLGVLTTNEGQTGNAVGSLVVDGRVNMSPWLDTYGFDEFVEADSGDPTFFIYRQSAP